MKIFEIIITSRSGHKETYHDVDWYDYSYSAEDWIGNYGDDFCEEKGYLSCSYDVDILKDKDKIKDTINKTYKQLAQQIVSINKKKVILKNFEKQSGI